MTDKSSPPTPEEIGLFAFQVWSYKVARPTRRRPGHASPTRAETPSSSTRLLAEFRVKHKPKRNLMALLDG
jgi:hypothetical protein